MHQRPRRSTQPLDGAAVEPGLLEAIAQLAVTIAVPAAIVSALAFWCARRHAPRSFLYAVLLVACVMGPIVVTAMQWLNPYAGGISSWHDALGAMAAWAPVIVLPGAFVWACVKGTISRGWIPALSVLGVVLAMPIGFIVGSMLA